MHLSKRKWKFSVLTVFFRIKMYEFCAFDVRGSLSFRFHFFRFNSCFRHKCDFNNLFSHKEWKEIMITRFHRKIFGYCNLFSCAVFFSSIYNCNRRLILEKNHSACRLNVFVTMVGGYNGKDMKMKIHFLVTFFGLLWLTFFLISSKILN